MSLSLVSGVIVAITLGAAPTGPKDPYSTSSPSIEGKWELVIGMADGELLPLHMLRDHMLRDTEIDIADGVMTFPFTLGPLAVQNTRQLRIEFVGGGLDVTYPGTSHITPLPGTWSMHGETFRFCYATDEKQGRPRLCAGKGVNYMILKRSTRDAERRAEKSAQETLSRAVAQLEEIVREDGSTNAGKKAKEVLKTLGFDVWCDGRVYPTGTFVSVYPWIR